MTRWSAFSSLFALASGLLLAPGRTDAAAKPRGAVVSLASGMIDVTAPPEVPPDLQAPDAGYYLVKFPGPVAAAQKQALESAVERVYTYLPHDTFLVKAGPELQDAAAFRPLGARWVGAYHPAYKIAPLVAAAAPPSEPLRAGAAAPLRLVMLHVYPDADLEAVRAAVAGVGATRIVGAAANPFFSRIRLLATDAEVAALREPLAKIPEVFWVALEGRITLFNDTTIWVGQSGVNGGQTTPIFNHGIHGEGQVVGIIDTGLDADMCYFRDQALGLPPVNACNGGTTTNP